MANFIQKLKEFFLGSPDKVMDYNKLNPEQQQVQSGINKSLLGSNQSAFDWLNSIINDEEGAFEDYEAPLKEQFEQYTIPMLLEKFGGIGAKNSSAFQQTLGEAGRGYGRDIAAQRANLKGNAVQMLQNYGNQGLNQSQSPYIQGGTKGLVGMINDYSGGLANKYWGG